MNSVARLRDRCVLQEQILMLTRQTCKLRAMGFHDGSLAALRWLTEGGPGPLTGCLSGLPISMEAIVRELAGAEAVIYGSASQHREYCHGIEHALMWARFATPEPPCRLMSPRAGTW